MGIESLISRNLKQTAVYWGSPNNDGYGQNTFSTAVEVSCRWEKSYDKQKNIRKNKNGKEFIPNARIFIEQDMDEEGYIFLGELSDLDSDHTDPVKIEGAWEIMKFEKIPELNRSNKFQRIAYI